MSDFKSGCKKSSHTEWLEASAYLPMLLGFPSGTLAERKLMAVMLEANLLFGCGCNCFGILVIQPGCSVVTVLQKQHENTKTVKREKCDENHATVTPTPTTTIYLWIIATRYIHP